MQLERFGFRAMGSPCELQLWGPSRAALRPLATSCRDEVARLERKFSRYRDESLTSRIARSAGDPRGLEVDEETAALLDFAQTAWRESEGRFDPTSGVLRRAWDFKSGRLPDRRSLEGLCGLVGWSKLRWDQPRLVLPIPGMELDFGGFVKEYAADRVAELCRERGLASGLIDLGGDLAVVGPHPDGSPWLVGIRNPRRPESALARVALSSGGLASSGDYERFMMVEGERYSHILDPRSGWSFRGGPAGVSVVAGHCLIAGVTSTIAMLHEQEESLDFLERVGLPHLVVDGSGRVAGTANAVAATTAPQRVITQDRVGSTMRSVSQPSS
ncbi:MAG: FAD:protein FMN transferase [Deltaproteobacteria bacterium]|jgi:thiamine biosynthesis lipoprotein|nr:FAD:protein FMN transferase [Deltaproteobacteria bacterium]